MENVRKMRLIKEAIAYYKEIDPQTALTENALRRLVKNGEVKSVRIGAKYLVDMANLDSYLAGPSPEPDPPAEWAGRKRIAAGYGTIRKIQKRM
jgi:hypothetical protein